MRLALFLALLTFVMVSAQEVDRPRAKPEACWRDATSRGSGKLPDRASHECPKERPEKNAGLCYPKCSNAAMVGMGPICWEDCTKTKYASNGVVFCCKSDDVCSELVADLGKKLPEALVRFALDVAVNPSNILKLFKDFRILVSDALELELPMCSKLQSDGQSEDETDMVVPSGEAIIVAQE